MQGKVWGSVQIIQTSYSPITNMMKLSDGYSGSIEDGFLVANDGNYCNNYSFKCAVNIIVKEYLPGKNQKYQNKIVW